MLFVFIHTFIKKLFLLFKCESILRLKDFESKIASLSMIKKLTGYTKLKYKITLRYELSYLEQFTTFFIDNKLIKIPK